jgi:hypothetical protein
VFAVGLSIVTGMLFSSAPAWAMARTNPADALGRVSRNTEQRSFLPRRWLVVTQVALSLVAMTAAGLLTKSLQRLERQPLGFATDSRIVARVLPSVRPDDLNLLSQYNDRMLARLRRIPGVLDATFSRYSPMEGNNWQSRISILGRPAREVRFRNVPVFRYRFVVPSLSFCTSLNATIATLPSCRTVTSSAEYVDFGAFGCGASSRLFMMPALSRTTPVDRV